MWNADANKALIPNSKKKFHPINPKIRKNTIFCPEASAIGRIFLEKIVNAATQNKVVLTIGTDTDESKITEFLDGFTRPLMDNAATIAAKTNLISITSTFPQDILANALSKILSVEAKIKIGKSTNADINSTLMFFLYNLNSQPATKPAKPVLSKHTTIVPTGEKAKKKLIVDGAVKTKIPLTRPKNKPPNGPYNIAPTAIGNKDKVIETGPNWT